MEKINYLLIVELLLPHCGNKSIKSIYECCKYFYSKFQGNGIEIFRYFKPIILEIAIPGDIYSRRHSGLKLSKIIKIHYNNEDTLNIDDITWSDTIYTNDKIPDDILITCIGKLDNMKYFYKYNQLSNNFIRKYLDILDWQYIWEYHKFDIEFIKEFEHKITNCNHMAIWYNKNLDIQVLKYCVKYIYSIGFIDCISVTVLYTICQNNTLDEEFIEQHIDTIFLKHVIHPKLSEKFIEKHWKLLMGAMDISRILRGRKLNKVFMDKYIGYNKHQLIKIIISECELDSEFVCSYYSNNYENITRYAYKYFNENFIKNNIHRLSIDIILGLCENLSEDFIEWFINEYNVYTRDQNHPQPKIIPVQFIQSDYLYTIKRCNVFRNGFNQTVSNEFILKYAEQFSQAAWTDIFKNHTFSEDMILECVKYISVHIIYEYQNVSFNFIMGLFMNTISTPSGFRFDFDKILQYTNISEKDLRDYIHLFDKSEILKYQKISKTFAHELINDVINNISVQSTIKYSLFRK